MVLSRQKSQCEYNIIVSSRQPIQTSRLKQTVAVKIALRTKEKKQQKRKSKRAERDDFRREQSKRKKDNSTIPDIIITQKYACDL